MCAFQVVLVVQHNFHLLYLVVELRSPESVGHWFDQVEGQKQQLEMKMTVLKCNLRPMTFSQLYFHPIENILTTFITITNSNLI